jgi:hypothetical protein
VAIDEGTDHIEVMACILDLDQLACILKDDQLRRGNARVISPDKGTGVQWLLSPQSMSVGCAISSGPSV